MLIIRKSVLLLNWFPFVTIVRYMIHDYLSFSAIQQGTEFLTVCSCAGYNIKIKLAA